MHPAAVRRHRRCFSRKGRAATRTRFAVSTSPRSTRGSNPRQVQTHAMAENPALNTVHSRV